MLCSVPEEVINDGSSSSTFVSTSLPLSLEIDDSESLYSTGSEGERNSVKSSKSGVLQEIFASLRISSPNAEEEAYHRPQTPLNNWREQFGAPDTPENIALDGKGKIVAATLCKLIEKLTTTVDNEFMEDFLVGYRGFMKPRILAEMLSFRLKDAFTPPGSLEKQTMKVRTFVVLRTWIQNYRKVDFTDSQLKRILSNCIHEIQSDNVTVLTVADQQILSKLKQFLSGDDDGEISSAGVAGIFHPSTTTASSLSQSMSMTSLGGLSSTTSTDSLSGKIPWSKRLKLRIKEFLKDSRDEDSMSTNAPSVETTVTDVDSFYPRRSCLLAESSQIISEQLCLIEAQVFSSVPWTEVLYYLDVGRVNEGLEKSISHFNRTCEWIVGEILRAASITEQGNLIAKLIRIAMKCLGASNFNSVMQIMLALQTSTVEELHQAWDRLSDYEHDVYEDLTRFVGPVRNFRNLRKAMELLEVSTRPCIPFTGLYLADLASSKERSREDISIKSKDLSELIPWYKYQVSATIIRQFRSFQSADRKYTFTYRSNLSSYILDRCSDINANSDIFL